MNRLLTALMCVMVICSVAATAAVVRREFGHAPDVRPTDRQPVDVKSWLSLAQSGNRYGGESAVVVITQFSDYQCPFCRRLHGVLLQVEKKYGAQVAFVFRHLPLGRIHPHARTAAHAAECAARAGKFRPFHDVLYEKQDSLGLVGWGALAMHAGMNGADTVALGECMRDEAIARRVTDDSIAAMGIGARGTPTVLVNNWLLPGTPTFAQLDSTIQRLLEGKG